MRVFTDLHYLRDLGRDIWGSERLSLEGVVVRLSVDVGKLARIARGADKDLVCWKCRICGLGLQQKQEHTVLPGVFCLATGRDEDFEQVAPELREQLETAMGNIIFSMIRWCDDLGLDPIKCIVRAIECQTGFAERNASR